MRVDPEMQQLDRESYQIVGMICSEQVPDAEIDLRIDALRQQTMQFFDERPALFDETYGRRFQRLRTRFRPARGLFDSDSAR